MRKKIHLPRLRYNADGLIPAIVQDRAAGTVLMFAFMNREAVRKTIATGEAHFFSRSRQTLWHKGATSGNTQRVTEIRVDCDADTLLLLVEPAGPACHTGAQSCFEPSSATLAGTVGPGVLNRVYEVILERKRNSPPGSYVAGLFAAGTDGILKKIGEEAGEVIISGKNRDRRAVVWEIADLWFHTLVMLASRGIAPNAVFAELDRRAQKKPTAPGAKRRRAPRENRR